ncbi:MAG: hypothetical protein AAGD86_11955, partial [Pseudomonadota bacterium]
MSGTAGDGISAATAAGASTLDVTTTGAITGAVHGIDVSQAGTGAVTVTTSGAVEGTAGNGINLVNTGASAVTVTATGTVSGVNGLDIDAGDAAHNLDVGAAGPGADTAIRTVTQAGTQIVIEAGASVTGGTAALMTTGQAGTPLAADTVVLLGTINGDVLTMEGDDTVTLGNGATVTGTVLLGEGVDTLNLDGATTAVLDGGADTDTLSLNAAGSTLAGESVSNFEIYDVLADGQTFTGVHGGLEETRFQIGEQTLLGELQSTAVAVADGAALRLGNGAQVTGALVNEGALSLAPEVHSQALVDGTFTQTATGATTIDTFSAAVTDRLTVTGDVTLDGTLNVNQTGSMRENVTLIDGQGALTGEFATVNGMFANGLIVNQSIVYDRENGDVNLEVGMTDFASLRGLTANQRLLGEDLFRKFMTPGVASGLENVAFRIGGLATIDEFGAALDELRPEMLSAGVTTVHNAQLGFLHQLMNIEQTLSGGGATTAALGTKPRSGLSAGDGTGSGEPAYWTAFGVGGIEQETNSATFDFDQTGYDLGLGVYGLQAGSYSVGFSLGFAEFEAESTSDAVLDETDTRYAQLGAHLTRPFSAYGFALRFDAAGAYARGTHDVDMGVVVPASGTGFRQTGETDFFNVATALRFTLDGTESSPWLIKPYALFAGNWYRQDELRIGTDQPTALRVNEVD